MGLDRNFTRSSVVAYVQNTTKEMNFLAYFRLYIDYPNKLLAKRLQIISHARQTQP